MKVEQKEIEIRRGRIRKQQINWKSQKRELEGKKLSKK